MQEIREGKVEGIVNKSYLELGLSLCMIEIYIVICIYSYIETCEDRDHISVRHVHTQCSVQTIIFPNKYLITKMIKKKENIVKNVSLIGRKNYCKHIFRVNDWKIAMTQLIRKAFNLKGKIVFYVNKMGKAIGVYR